MREGRSSSRPWAEPRAQDLRLKSVYLSVCSTADFLLKPEPGGPALVAWERRDTLSTMSPVNNTSRPPATGSAPGRRPSTPQEHDLSATYSPGDGDFFGDHWAATSSNSRFRREEADSTSVSTVGSPDRRAVKPSNPLYVASASTQMMQSNSVQSSPGRGNDSGDAGRESDRDRRPRHRTVPSQRAMLAKALEKANSAVVLDNESEYQKAMDAYSEACDLLHQVMTRSGTEEDKTKLDAIVSIYGIQHYLCYC